MKTIKIGIDIGSTTMKLVVLDENNGLLFDDYRRHQTRVNEILMEMLVGLRSKFGDVRLSINVTGSVGMGVAERLSLPFVQEVIAATKYINVYYSQASTMIDIGGEDAKIVFLSNGGATDLRMNGNCAGGTGAFIDQMAILLNSTPEELGKMAEHSTKIYPIASRCGVFCKTDIQNLIARNVPKQDIAASIFHAVAVQTVVTLAHGHEIDTPILLCGGPLAFIPALRKAFADYLNIDSDSFILPDKAGLLPAWGCALSATVGELSIADLIERLNRAMAEIKISASGLPVIFKSEEDYCTWKSNKSRNGIEKAELKQGVVPCYIGIDSGSTTTKIVVLDSNGSLLFSYYSDNNGNPIKTVEEGLQKLQEECNDKGSILQVMGSCSTGYGEDLIKAAFKMKTGIVETMAHYMAARHLDRNVSFVLDIGGQDMKAMFVNDGVINRIEVNEACSSGCGSFISTFARSLGQTVEEFAKKACLSTNPCDLGTRCTVFMNSKVKQVLREGASISDISAGLSYSVVKNCLYKVLRIKSIDELGNHIVVQGGTMLNDSVVRALEILTGKEVTRSNYAQLMGAVGCALYAMQMQAEKPMALEDMLANTQHSTSEHTCSGCVNRCAITKYKFNDGSIYFSGNRCEKIFSNKGESGLVGENAYDKRRELLFNRNVQLDSPLMTIGVPRVLNMFEEYPFWHTLFTKCNIQVRLSAESVFSHYEKSAGKVMSDNICFPAKLVHSHIENLVAQKVDRIFMPFVLFEKKDSEVQNSYNCPIVTGYSQVVKSVHTNSIPIDSPVVSFKDKKALIKQCKAYLSQFGVKNSVAENAIRLALKAQQDFDDDIAKYNRRIFEKAKENGQLVIMLAGRPYHSDALIQHKVGEMVSSLGVCVLTADIVNGMHIELHSKSYLSQWSFPNKIVQAAQWCALQDASVQYMELTSFGCGPDAFLTEEVQAILKRSGKKLTLLKIDDVNNIGSLKLRARSLIQSLKLSAKKDVSYQKHDDSSLPCFGKEHRNRKILIPFFTPFISPLLPSILKCAGYDAENLPSSDITSAEWGLKNSNNEVCYPATLIVGDIVKAFKSGAYNPDECCVALTQTGGQCRASNYLSLIRKALVENGYTNTPVISVSFGSGISNEQPGFTINWLKMLPVAIASVLYSDCIAKMYYATVSRSVDVELVDGLRDYYLNLACGSIEKNRTSELYGYLKEAAGEFNKLCVKPAGAKVGLVGEIFLKYNPFAQKSLTEWLVGQGVEIVYPMLTDFFIQSFVNMKQNARTWVNKKLFPDWLANMFYKRLRKEIDRYTHLCDDFKPFTAFDDIFEKAAKAAQSITLSAQFGEGWLIAGEVSVMAEQGVKHVVSLQPFGCIANHIVEKGIENKLKKLYPSLNILSLDFDSSVSEVNITNRLL